MTLHNVGSLNQFWLIHLSLELLFLAVLSLSCKTKIRRYSQQLEPFVHITIVERQWLPNEQCLKQARTSGVPTFQHTQQKARVNRWALWNVCLAVYSPAQHGYMTVTMRHTRMVHGDTMDRELRGYPSPPNNIRYPTLLQTTSCKHLTGDSPNIKLILPSHLTYRWYPTDSIMK